VTCLGIRHAHHGSSESICLLFACVACQTDGKSALEHSQDRLISQRALENQDGMLRLAALLLRTIRNLPEGHDAALPPGLAGEHSR